MHVAAIDRSTEVSCCGAAILVAGEMKGYGRRLAVAVAVAVAAACAAGGTSGAAAWGWQQPLAPCMYIFGDSLVDSGNNNNMLSLARANYRPYGIDFHEGPAGRFTNGRTMVDFLSDMLRLRPPLLPPYATARPEDHPHGVNFASGASGVLPETGNNLGGHYPFSEQVDHFRAAVGDMGNATAEFHGNATRLADHLARCIFFVGIGSNDYLNNYYMPSYYDTAQSYSPRDYAALLLQGYAAQITRLYGLGARKFVIAGVGQIGCIPYELARMNNDNRPSGPSNQSAVASDDIALSIAIGVGGGGGGGWRSSSMPPYTDNGNGNSNGNGNGYGNGSGSGNGDGSGSGNGDGNSSGSGKGTGSGNGNGSGSTNPTTPADAAGGCNETINSGIDIYNKGLLSMVKRFNRGPQMRGAKFVFLDTVQIGKDLAASASAHGFTVLDRGCCGVGRNNGQITCLPLQRPCDDRSKYMFWDAFHPTEAANKIYAAKAFGSNSTADVYPINVSQLAAI